MENKNAEMFLLRLATVCNLCIIAYYLGSPTALIKYFIPIHIGLIILNSLALRRAKVNGE